MMRTGWLGPVAAHVLALTLLAGAARPARAQARPAGKCLSPRATVQTLYAAVGAARENPRFIKEAAACLDLSGPGTDRRDPGLLAVELEAVLRAADVNSERIPEGAEGDAYALSGPEGGRIALRRQADGRWLFDRETVARIPRMGAASRAALQAKNIVLALGVVLHLMALFAWDVTAVLTGLGIGGVAFALGAQDSLRNLFGSFTLIADRPFVVGETVRIGDGGLGVVERVGLRSTSIRTVEDTLLVVPNSNLTTMSITNFGRRRFRRFTGRIGVAYGTPPERLTAFRDAVRAMALGQKWTRRDQCEVGVHELTASAIEIQVNVFLDVATSHEEAEAREALLLGCLRLAEQMRIDLTIPTQAARVVPDGEAASPTLALRAEADGEGEEPRRASA